MAGCHPGFWNLIASFSVEGDDVLGGLSLPLGSAASVTRRVGDPIPRSSRDANQWKFKLLSRCMS